MPAEYKLERCEATDPNRCQGNDSFGQCTYKAVEGCTMCGRHGANTQIKAQELKRTNEYRLQQWQQRVDEFSASESCRTLRGEVGILRLMLESTMAQCKDQKDLMMFSHRIGDLVMKIDRVVSSVNKIEMRSGNLLDKSGALILAGQIVEVISAELGDNTAAIDRISSELIDLVVKLAGKDSVTESD